MNMYVKRAVLLSHGKLLDVKCAVSLWIRIDAPDSKRDMTPQSELLFVILMFLGFSI